MLCNSDCGCSLFNAQFCIFTRILLPIVVAHNRPLIRNAIMENQIYLDVRSEIGFICLGSDWL